MQKYVGITRHMLQQSQYNGHKRHHGFKFQDIIAPNGLIISCYGPVDGRRADPYILVRSGVLTALPHMQDSTGHTHIPRLHAEITLFNMSVGCSERVIVLHVWSGFHFP